MTLQVRTAEYAVSAVNRRQYPQANQPEIALVGRSNVGKSSFLNKFMNRRNLARTSSTPGKTQTINFYQINGAWYLVDLPGYGFARVSQGTKSGWGRFINEYLYKRQPLVGIIQIVDIRHAPSQDDVMMHDWLVHSGLPYLIAVSKADKIARGQYGKQLKLVKDTLQVPPEIPVVVCSAQTGEGIASVAAWVEELLLPFKLDQ
jgi:GTP-binding protein